MSTLTLLAIVLQLADAGQTCAALRTGRAHEANAAIGAQPSCAKVLAIKGVALAPLALPLPKRYHAALQVGNIGAGGVGVSVSVVTFWGRK